MHRCRLVLPDASIVHLGNLLTIRSDYNPLRWLMGMDGQNGRSCGLGNAPLAFIIVHCPGQKHQVPDGVPRLPCDIEPVFPTDDDEMPDFEDEEGLTVLTRRAPWSKRADSEKGLTTADGRLDQDLGELTDEDDFELDAIDLYLATDLGAELDLDDQDALEDAIYDSKDPEATMVP